jgi:hypothetical protein
MGWLARSTDVVCTELEDGAVLLNLDTRLYYSLNEVGLEVWNLLEAVDGPQDAAGELARAFDVDETTAQNAISSFVEELQRERLVVAAPDGTTSATAAAAFDGRPPRADGKRPFEAPELIQHDEPLHEVSSSPFDPQLPLAE